MCYVIVSRIGIRISLFTIVPLSIINLIFVGYFIYGHCTADILELMMDTEYPKHVSET